MGSTPPIHKICTHPLYIFSKRLTVTGPQDLKLDMRVRSIASEVH